VHDNTLQHTAKHFSTLQDTATQYTHGATMRVRQRYCQDYGTATHCNALQRTATHCNTLQHMVQQGGCASATAQVVELQHTATHCHAMQHIATHCNTLQHPAAQYTRGATMRVRQCYCQGHGTASQCSTLQHTATHCNTLQHNTHVVQQ